MFKQLKSLKLLHLVLVFLILASISISFYLFFYRKVGITKDLQTFERILLEDVSDVVAEKMNYDKVETNFQNYNLEEISYFEYSEPTLTSNLFARLINWKDSKFEFDNSKLVNNIPIVYSEFYENYNASNFADLLKAIISENNLNYIVLDSSLQSNLEDYYAIIDELSQIDGLNLSLLLLPRTAELENYSNYKEFNKNITKIVDINRIAHKADFFFIETYDYTPDLAALPGPNVNLEEVEDSAQYYIYKGLPREKIYLGVNKVNLMWIDRYFEEDIKKNMIISNKQAELFLENQNLVVNKSTLKSGEVYGEFEKLKDDKVQKYTVIISTQNLENNIKQIALKYNLRGLFYRY